MTRPIVMGILNVTPDSFSDGGCYGTLETAFDRAAVMVNEGADVIDVGGESTRPGSDGVDEAVEIERVVPVIERIARNWDIAISVDTSKPAVMAAATLAGACIVNDVNALRAPGARDWASKSAVGVCLMHMRGEPRTMQENPFYRDVVAEVCAFLTEERAACLAAGIPFEAIALDPGIGFGKGWEHNQSLLQALPRLAALGSPLLVGVSRKSFIGRILGRQTDGRLYGGIGLAALAVSLGARIIRTHDVAPTHDALRMVSAVLQGPEPCGLRVMTMRYFGTDGVRGRVGHAPMTVDFALRLASAAARVLAPKGGRVLIGKDTRLSGYLFESALEAGFVAAGVDVMLIGPLPTPGIAYMTQRLACSFGVVISASHNSYEDNGIKFFDATGSKLSDEIEDLIERSIDEPVVTQESQHLGRAVRIDESRTQYQEFCASTIPAGMTLEGFKIVIDCANGAGYKVAPRVLADLGAEIVPIGCSPNGRNINDGCGSTAPELLQLTVPGVRAQVGLALDGDGDRVVMVDELGRCVDGDQILYILATHRHAGALQGPVVGTVMSNLGLEHALAERHIEFLRAQVGDRYVLGMLNETGGTLGGETSGHILCLDKTTTGDGLVSALQVLAVMKATGAGLAELAAPMRRYPQVLLNVPVARRFDPMAEPSLIAAVAAVERQFNGRGRIVLRASGTEQVIRVMVEGYDASLVKRGARDIVAAVEAAAVEATAMEAAAVEAVGAPAVVGARSP